MLSPSGFHELVSGRRRGFFATLARGLLSLAEFPYTAIVRLRNRRYDSGRTPIHSASVPVVCVGNITLGGTGKSPLVEWIARYLRSQSIRVTIVSRGYGATDSGRNDEALELEQKLPDVPHVQNPDRVAAAAVAVEELDCQLVLLDDGFQHRRLARDLDIVLLDALEPFGFDHVFPRGLLREPLEGLARAGAIILSRADLVDAETRKAIRQRALRYSPNAHWLEAAHSPRRLVSAADGEAKLDTLAGLPLVAFCGIGAPAGFRATLDRCGYQPLLDFREFPDHHAYDREDIESLTAWASEQGAKAIVCTQKDLVKIGVTHLGQIPLWAVAIELEITHGQSMLHKCLDSVISSCPS